MPSLIHPDQLARDLALRDLTDPGAGPHAVQLVVEHAIAALQAYWGCAVWRMPGPRVVAVADNYDALGFDPAAVTRDARYTRYVDSTTMLRSHSSALIPAALRRLGRDDVDDVLIACPGVVFRRDAIDRLHTGTPHQLDLWRMRRRPTGEDDLTEMIELLGGALAPGRELQTEPRVHPYTKAGRQVDVRDGGGWVEIAECGLAHPEVIARAGVDPAYSGLALGMGLDRLVMLAKGLPDIRLLRSGDPRVASQMLDLAPYRAVSSMPAVVRDVSVAVDRDDTVEDLGDRVRDALGEDASAVEEVTILSSTPCGELPEAARTRLGARVDQMNLLVRLVLRDLDRTLTDAEANSYRDAAFAALHRGGRSAYETSTVTPGDVVPKTRP